MSRILVSLAWAFALLAGRTLDAAETWQQFIPTQPFGAHAATAHAYDPVSGRLIVFGGLGAIGYLDDTYAFDGATWTKLSFSIRPSPRAAASMAYDSALQKLVLFGGYNGSQYLGDTWIFDGSSSSWTQATPTTAPPGVTAPMLFTDPSNGHAVCYGGYDGHFYQLSTYRFTGTNWQKLTPATSPTARSAAIAALDPVRQRVVLFGGLGSVNPNNTWEWDGVNWALKSPAHQPVLRYDSAAVFDPRKNAVVLFGGASGGAPLDDTWTWNGIDWIELTTTAKPQVRESHAMAYLPNIGRIVIAGGQAQVTIYKDTWFEQDVGTIATYGAGSGGALGPATLTASGDLSPGSPFGLTLSLGNAQPNQPLSLLFGTQTASIHTNGGILAVFPIVLLLPAATGPGGALVANGAIPIGFPSGVDLRIQAWIADPTSIFQVGSTNGLTLSVP